MTAPMLATGAATAAIGAWSGTTAPAALSSSSTICGSDVDLSTVPDHLLIEELARRARKRARTKPDDLSYCDECVHFRFWTEHSDPPNGYNPCALNHKMVFQPPENDSGAFSGDFGFFRAVCEDREARPC